jgi:type II secretory pathway predicted ATPase ExeA
MRNKNHRSLWKYRHRVWVGNAVSLTVYGVFLSEFVLWILHHGWEGAGVYWSHFGLERQPFRPAVDPDAYFPSPTHEEALAALAAGFARRDPIVSIDGRMGVGKSLVARKWLEHLLPDVQRVVLPNACAERPAALHQAILFDMGKPYQGLTDPELRLAVTGHLLDAASQGNYPIVLVLDEAQHLSQTAIEELRLLGNLETRQGAVIFTVLVAQSSLREALRQPAYELFAHRVAVHATVVPLTLAESLDYIKQQISAVGGVPEKLIDDSAMSLLAGACEGIPRILNRASALAMELAASAKAEQVDVEAGLEALARLGLTASDDEEPDNSEGSPSAVLLPHPARSAEPARSGRGKSTDGAGGDEDAAIRGPKERASRKRNV